MAIHLRKPYKIVPGKHKKYESHYHIPAENALIVPVKEYGEEVACDIRWENENGELKELHNVVIISDNLAPLNSMIEDKLFELWSHYYGDQHAQGSAQRENH